MRKLLPLLLVLGSCYLARYPVTPAVATPETFEVLISEGTGTAFAVGPHTVITAGHVCYLEAAEGHENIWLRTGRVAIRAKMVAWEMTPDVSGDLCVLHTDADLGPGLILADAPPQFGAKDTVIGYPLGVFTVSHGTVVGPAVTTAPHDHGSSGAPMFTDRGVYGVVVQEGTAQCPVSELRRFLDEVGVSYDITPPQPDNNDNDPFGA